MLIALYGWIKVFRNLPSWIFVDFDVHASSHPNEMQFSHGSCCGKPICRKPHTLGMIASNFLHWNQLKCDKRDSDIETKHRYQIRK